MTERRGFTLIELLVTMAVILLLLGLLLPALAMARRKAQDSSTSVRIEAVLQAVAQLGHSEHGAAFELMRRAGLEGVAVFTRDADGRPVPETDRERLARAGVDPERNRWLQHQGHPERFAVPWGQPVDANGNGRFGESGEDPERRHLGQLSPARSSELLLAAGLIPDLAAYAEDRSPERPWNDAWGNPLVLAYGIYQPGEDPQQGPSPLQAAQRRFGHARAVYLAVGAVGPQPRERHAQFERRLEQQWSQITSVCAAEDWDQGAFASPPWEGIRLRPDPEQPRGRCFLSAPAVFK